MKKYDEYEYEFEINLGRAFNGVQKSMNKQAIFLGLDINIIRIPYILSITYRVVIRGKLNNIQKFIEWFNYNYGKNTSNGEQEEEMGF